jgi:extracellular matrix protein 14
VVLRFNLSTPEEEKALAEVADTLFLDIWGFANNWADIRLREDDVCPACGFRGTIANMNSDPITSGLAAKISSKCLLKPNARPSEDDIQYVPFHRSSRASHYP